MNSLYTFIMHYLGGTYIAQAEAETKEQAIRVWLKNLDIKQIEGFSKRDKEKAILNDFINDDPALIMGTTNVWCIGILTRKGYAIVNFVKTERA